MASPREFPFHKARRVTPLETEKARRAIEELTGKPRKPRRGRPPKAHHERYRPVSLRLDPRALAWAKDAARRRGIGYQTVINEALLLRAGSYTKPTPAEAKRIEAAVRKADREGSWVSAEELIRKHRTHRV